MDLLNTIGQVGDSLDKVTGGRALRGTLAGKPRELASFVPWSDEMGLTNAKDKTSGRDLTDQYGLTTKGSDSFGSHAAGFLADTVLSPGNLIGAYGAFKAAPTLAKGVVGAGKALSGLDLFDHLSSGGKALGRFAKTGSFAADPVADYAKLTAHFPKDQPLGMHVPIRGDSAMPLLEEGVDSYRQNKQMIDRKFGQTGGIGDLYHAHQTTLPGTSVEGPAFGQGPHFHQGPTAPMSGGQPITDEMWAKLMNFGGDEGGWLKVPIPGVDPHTANAMDALGPQYPGGIQKLHDLAHQSLGGTTLDSSKITSSPGFESWLAQQSDSGKSESEAAWLREQGRTANPTDQAVHHRLLKIIGDPHAERIAGEIPHGSSYLGAGAESMSFRAPDGSVVRLADRPFAAPHLGRPDIPGMLQPARQTDIGNYTVERLPFVDKLHGDQADYAAEQLAKSIESQGHEPWDVFGHNVARTPEGNALTFDAGAVRHGTSGRDAFYKPTVHESPQGDLLAQVLAQGGPSKVQESIRQGLGQGTAGQGISIPEKAGLWEALKDSGQADGIKRQPDAMLGFGKQIPKNHLHVDLSANGDTLNRTLEPWQRAEQIGKQANVYTKMINKSTADKIARANDWSDPAELTAWYKGDKHVIGLNPNSPEWFDHGAMRDYMQSVGPQGTGWLSSSHPDHIIQHELGHAAHREGLGMDAFMNDPTLRATHEPDWAQFLKSNLSNYGATKPTETIAELIAALQSGRTLSPELIPLLKHHGGNNLFQNLGDHGLLKGLGLSALLGAGITGASSGGPEQPQQLGAA